MQIERRSLAFRAARAAKVKPVAASLIVRLKDGFTMEEGFSMLPFNPPKFQKKKDGSLKELKWKLRFLLCQIERDPEPFKIMRRTDAATILKHSRRIVAAEFESAASDFLASFPVKEAVATPSPRPSMGWDIPASGKDCRRGENTPSRKRFVTSDRDLVRIAQAEALALAKHHKWEKEHGEA